MKQLIADSTNIVYYTPNTYPLTTLTLAVTDEDGTAVTVAGAVTADATNERYSVTLASTEITSASHVWQRLKFAWTATLTTQALVDVEYAEVALSARPEPLVAIKDVIDYAGITSSTSTREILAGIIDATTDAVMAEIGWKSPSQVFERVTESRTFYLHESRTYVRLPYCTAVTAITDADSEALEHTVIAGTGDDDFIRWVELDTTASGLITVAGTWGYTEIPSDITQAALITAMLWFRRDVAVHAQGIDVETGFIERPTALPRQVVRMLAHHREYRL